MKIYLTLHCEEQDLEGHDIFTVKLINAEGTEIPCTIEHSAFEYVEDPAEPEPKGCKEG